MKNVKSKDYENFRVEYCKRYRRPLSDLDEDEAFQSRCGRAWLMHLKSTGSFTPAPDWRTTSYADLIAAYKTEK